MIQIKITIKKIFNFSVYFFHENDFFLEKLMVNCASEDLEVAAVEYNREMWLLANPFAHVLCYKDKRRSTYDDIVSECNKKEYNNLWSGSAPAI